MTKLISLVASGILVALFAQAGAISNQIRYCGAIMAETNLVSRVGFLAEDIKQNSIITAPSLREVEGGQFYFDVGVKSNLINQIIVVYSAKMKIPTDKGKTIELIGTVDRISVKDNKVGDVSCEIEVLKLKTWRYLFRPSHLPPRY